MAKGGKCPQCGYYLFVKDEKWGAEGHNSLVSVRQSSVPVRDQDIYLKRKVGSYGTRNWQ